MTEATRVGVAVVISEIRVVLGAVVVGQFENAGDRLHPLGARGGVGGDLVFIDQREEVQAELGFREVALFHQRETQDARVEVQGLGDVLDPQHGVVEDKLLGRGVRLCGNAGEGVQFLQAHGPSGK
ncbi:hypothetical protein D3C86_1311010 [compost metagenome]